MPADDLPSQSLTCHRHRRRCKTILRGASSFYAGFAGENFSSEHFHLSDRVHGTCAFAEASPQGKNPRAPSATSFLSMIWLYALAATVFAGRLPEHRPSQTAALAHICVAFWFENFIQVGIAPATAGARAGGERKNLLIYQWVWRFYFE